jgi:23S rRNA (cytidine1920-2'-O)/16S rRNA (cytidine1409-2'-O)-methyltransferase
VAADAPQKFVSRAGAKLEHALEEFRLEVTGLRCADFGCNVGGFTDCLLQRGAKHVTAIDTGYGALAWKLRRMNATPKSIGLDLQQEQGVVSPVRLLESDD